MTERFTSMQNGNDSQPGLVPGERAERDMASNDIASGGIAVKAMARLHMGFFDLNGGLGRRFGSIGVSLDQPAFVIKAYPSAHFTAELSAAASAQVEAQAAASLIKRAIALAQKLATGLPAQQGMHLCFEQIIPEHAGLGSGTQLSLAIGSAMNALYGLGLTINALALKTQRGARSGIGLGTFASGGVIVDGGRGTDTLIPPVIARAEFPPAWHILLIFDHAHRGLHGAAEIEAFRHLPNIAEDTADNLCRHVLMQALPALAEQDLPSFGNAIRELQQHTGDYFAPVQGGRYASERVAECLDWLQSQGVQCLGQSSWGPTGFAVFADKSAALDMQQRLQALYTAKSESGFYSNTSDSNTSDSETTSQEKSQGNQRGRQEKLVFMLAQGENHGAIISRI